MRGIPRRPLKDRLMEKLVVVQREYETPCWKFIGARSSKGYGCIGRGGQGNLVVAHRASWELFVGPIPDGLFVLHHCNRPPCCNPQHLYLGTNQDNMDFMVACGRASRDRFRGAKLTELEVGEIRFLTTEGQLTLQEIADEYGIGTSVVSNIKLGNTWIGVEPIEPAPPAPFTDEPIARRV